MFCNKTNADGVSLHQFPADESVRRQWIAFVRTKREPNSWTPGSGYICSDNFSANDYEGFGAKVAGFSSKLVLKKSAVPSIQASPTPEQINEARRIKRKLSLSNEKLRVEDSSSVVTQGTYTTPKRQSRALSKLTANRVWERYFSLLLLLAFVDLVSVYVCKLVAFVTKVVMYFKKKNSWWSSFYKKNGKYYHYTFKTFMSMRRVTYILNVGMATCKETQLIGFGCNQV